MRPPVPSRFRRRRQGSRLAGRGRGDASGAIDGVKAFSNSWNGYNDELVWGALWLRRAPLAPGGAFGSGRVIARAEGRDGTGMVKLALNAAPAVLADAILRGGSGELPGAAIPILP